MLSDPEQVFTMMGDPKKFGTMKKPSPDSVVCEFDVAGFRPEEIRMQIQEDFLVVKAKSRTGSRTLLDRLSMPANSKKVIEHVQYDHDGFMKVTVGLKTRANLLNDMSGKRLLKEFEELLRDCKIAMMFLILLFISIILISSDMKRERAAIGKE